jgi:hypothetical protein
MAEISYHDVARLLKADFETGRLYWLPRQADQFQDGSRHSAEYLCRWWNDRFAEKEALTPVNGSGYRWGRVMNKVCIAHRIIWLLHTRTWPLHQIDHINGDRLDNRIVNLRDVTPAENCKNQKMRSTNKSGIQGVCWFKTRGMWVAYIGKTTLGYFHSAADAAAVRRAAEVERGFHENHGRISAA